MVTGTTYETMETPQEGTGMRPGHTHVTEDCRAVSEVLQRIGDKWSILVVSRLGKGSLRFSELRNYVGGISQKMLTTTLRNLERDGFVTRTAFATIPPRVDYELTDLGRELLVPVDALSEWTRNNLARIDMARAEFDRRCTGSREGGNEGDRPS
jgi:DNA-binding HxlR family transcriptional regulator